MSNGRWIKLYRKFLEWPLFKSSPSAVCVFIDLLLTVDASGETRGTRLASVMEIAAETGLSEKTVRTALSRLVKDGSVSVGYRNGNRHSPVKALFTVVKWNEYQPYSTPVKITEPEPSTPVNITEVKQVTPVNITEDSGKNYQTSIPYNKDIIDINTENNTHTIENSGSVCVIDKAKKLANELWAIYPRKQDMSEAFSEVVHAAEREPDFEVFREKAVAAVSALRDITNGATDERKRFIPKMSTFFRKGSYMDDPETWRMQFGVFDARHGHGGYDFGIPVETQDKEQVEDVGKF